MSERQTVSRPSVKTTLKVGLIEAAIDLYKVTGKGPAAVKWERANADGSPLDSGTSPAKAPDAPALVGDPLGATAEPKEASSSVGEATVEVPEKPRKGIRKDDGVFVDLTDQIEQIAEKSKLERMEIISFIDTRHVPRERIIGAYYVACERPRLFAVLGTAMLEGRAAAVVRFSKRKGQTVGVMAPTHGGAFVLLELAFSEETRMPNKKCISHVGYEVADSEREQATALVKAMAGKRDSLDGIRDLRAAMERDLVAHAEAGELDEFELKPDDEIDSLIADFSDLLASATKEESARA